MSATNVVEITETVTEQPLSEVEAVKLHRSSASEAASRAKLPSAVRKAGEAFGRATVRKVLRAEFAGLTPSEILVSLES